ncbi:putative transcription factor C2C2-CO-like family [Helianthus debilis subsp. tardiflorus]
MEEANFKVGRYNAEERKEKIMKYRAKRTQRNFNKTIKYACRKTLADNRPRIRGRFARNDEPGELPKSTTFHQYGVDDELWVIHPISYILVLKMHNHLVLLYKLFLQFPIQHWCGETIKFVGIGSLKNILSTEYN